ncbi:MAG: ERAD-associated protein [Claussenomyces sp. TS43310]|nr:MAG: ERAD-associated protein [Claussenomyces sp. TS43310]
MYTFETIGALRIDQPPETYVYDILPLGDGVAAISSDDSLRLLDPIALHAPLNVVENVNRDVTCFAPLDGPEGLMVCTAGRDGKVCIVDPRQGAKVAEVKSDRNVPILSLATSWQNTSIAGGTELANSQASVIIWDTRFMDQPRLQYVESHSDDVTALQYHPTQKSILLSGSTDGLVNIYNTTILEEEDALHQTINHGASIHRSGFLTEMEVFALSHDEKFSTTQMVVNVDESVEEPPSVLFGDLRDKLGCEYVANVIARPGGGGVVGIGAHSREKFDLVHLHNEPPWALSQDSAVTLEGAHGSEIVRSFCFIDQHQMILTAVILQALLGIACARTDENPTPTAVDDASLSSPSAATSPDAQQSPTQGQRSARNTDKSSKLVDQALSSFRQLETANSYASSRKSFGLLGSALFYAKELIPRLYISGPPVEEPEVSQNADARLRGPLLEGVTLLEQAAKSHNADAIYLLAQLNFYGNFSYPKNHQEAFRRYHELAVLDGNSSAQHMVGFMYATGIGDAVERDQAKALLYHTFAAQAGHTKSEMTVAFRHHSGIGTVRNCDESANYYKSVADKAMKWYRSGPPGGRAWVSQSYRLADDDGGVYGEGASASSAGINAPKGGPNSDLNAALEDVLEYLDLMSGKGDFEATFSLGRIHYDGRKDLAPNVEAARRYFQTVATQYWKKDGTTVDISDKPRLDIIACKAAGYLGRMFLRGEGVEQNFKKASKWFIRGLKNGDAGSQHGLGLIYLHGLGLTQNIHKASDYFKAAAEQEYAPAQVSLGSLYLDQGSQSDIHVATRYFELAARYGHIEALYYLAEIINHGLGRERSCGLATAYYKSVAEKAEPLLSSISEANQAYKDGDNELALVGYLMAAEQGYERSQANVAYLLDQEKSVLPLASLSPFHRPRSALLKNAALALIFWTRSAKQTNIDSMVKMGDYYLNGIGTERDMEKAAACYTAASEYHQSAQALYNLGWMHENGAGLTQDFHLAKRYYDHALETNDEAYLPVTLSLLKLRARSAWNTLTHGGINSIKDEPAEKKHWSMGEWISNFLQDEGSPYEDDIDNDLLPHSDPMPGGDQDILYDDLIDDGIIESLIILGLAAALVWLIYYRQARQLAHRRGEEARIAQEGGQLRPAAQQAERGLFPQPGDPAFRDWVAGGIGH